MSMEINSSRVKIHGVYLDFVKSFDSVPLRNLHKLNKYHNLLHWIWKSNFFLLLINGSGVSSSCNVYVPIIFNFAQLVQPSV